MNTRTICIAVATIVGSCVGTAAGRQPDALDEALALVGLQREDLGWRPKGWWGRFPGDIPYKLRFFDSLFAEPLDSVAFGRALAHSAGVHLDPTQVDEKLNRDGHLYNAVHDLGIGPKFGALRGYSSNLTAEPTPLDEAVLTLIRKLDRPTRFYTFHMELPYPELQENLTAEVSKVPEAFRPILGKLVLDLLEADRWAELAFRRVDGRTRSVVARRYNLGDEQVDAYDFCPELDDLARQWDEACLWYAGGKVVEAVDVARVALAAAAADAGEVPPFAFDWESPLGWIRIRGSGNDTVDGHDTWLVVDLGGDDQYTGPVAASTADRPIGVLLDCGGNDRYTAVGPAQGAGMCGVGVLIDAAGDDTYTADRCAQGIGQFGLGLCADLGGDDTYFNKFSGQGCGYFGVGLLFDCQGNDAYRLYADGQGLGGISGVGTLADRKGDDTYELVRDSAVTGRPSYHSPDDNVSVSNGQGCAMGRRGDGADGHSYAGGLGALLDAEGNDSYLSGNWTMGTGYWWGMGLLHDGGGDDVYRGVCYTQATGAHFCIGVLIDEGGNDRHVAEVNSHSSIVWGHDFTIALLLDVGGDDSYEMKGDGMSHSINRSVTALIDTGGDDSYQGKEECRPGMAREDAKFHLADVHDVSTYWTDTTSVGLFLDIGGDDTYWSGHQDNTHWLDEPDSPNVADRNFSIGVDRPDGEVHFVPRPVRLPGGTRGG